ncbi:extracellular matrix protein 3-like, partial [Limulus polyphemus]|uniref:Extracellular matrix protein 3-like n=1 Tax=Limulus polyphemus TaxID=6850 RepID=A0ABM1BHY6_LIMPO
MWRKLSFVLFILLSCNILTHEQQHGASISESNIIESNNAIKVPFGRSVFIDPVKDLKIRVRDGDRCTVKVIQNDPLSQRPGKLTPTHFPCQFGLREVQYSHFGARTPPQDRVKLLLRYDMAEDTIIVPFTINVQVLFEQLEVVTRNMPITVEKLLGLSTPIDNKALQFTYNNNIQKCKVMTLGNANDLPRYGELVNNTSAGVLQDCDSFLKADIRYKHTFPYKSPNQDYIPMIVEITDSNGKLLKQEYFQVTVRIKDGQPNNPPQPSFNSLLLLDVNQFIMTAITPRILSAQDIETPSDKLIFNITSPLGYGEGQIISTDDQNVPISSFYQKDLDDLKIAYKPPASDSDIRRTFEVEMEVVDAEGLNSEPFSLMIVVHPKNTLAPLATRNSGLMLFEGQSRRLQSSKNLEIADENNIHDVTVSVVDGLRHGQLLFMGSPVKQFSPADLDAGLVTYQHDGSDTYSDNIIFRLDDGVKDVEFLFPITIYPEDDEPPMLNINTGLTISKGEEVEITPFVLSATDVDSDDFTIKFELQKPYSSEGEIFMKQFEPPDDPQNWDFVDGIYERPITTWTELNLLEGSIFYRHSGGHKTEPVMDYIKFRVSDDNVPPNESDDKEFVIKIMPIDNIPPKLYPGTPLEMIVDEFELTDITKKHLRFTDVDTKDRNLKYMITRKPYDTDSNNPLDPGKIVLSEKPDQEVTNFTQAQINHHKIAYKPPSVELGIIPRILQFEFQVEDSVGNILPGQTFIIRLRPVDNKPPTIHNKGLEVFENGFVTLSPDVLDAKDVDTDSNSIQFTVKQTPSYGILNYGAINLKEGSTFTKNDIANGLVSYINSGAEKENDKIELETSDGIHKVPVTINIQIRPIDDEAPALQISPGTIGTSLDVKENGSSLITTKIIKASDPDTDDLKITFLIDYPPRQGRIELNGANTDRFTQEDIEGKRVYYVHNGAEIGENSTTDTFNLSISDMSNDLLLGGNKIEYIHVNVNVEPVDSVAPVVNVGSKLVVPEANKSSVTLFHINATDIDTKDNDIVCTILVQPLHGYVENISPGPGSEKSRAGIPVTAFKISDIKNGYINYVQSVHKGVEPTDDRLTISCSDGINFSPQSVLPIQIDPTNDEIPQIFMREFVVEEGMKLSIDLPILNADDLDVPKDTLTFRLKNKPKHGKIVIQLATGDKEIDDFTLDQISKGSNIMYEHDDSETKEDEFELEITDGIHNASKKIVVMVYPVDDETPRLAINDGLEVGRGEVKLITNRVLKAEDIDTDDSTIMFVIRQPPKHGDLVYLHSISRLPLFNLTKGTNFTQGDIDEELIMYIHTGREGVRDLIKFDVTDGHNTYVDRYFWISVEGIDLVYPDVINKGVELLEGGKVTLTTDVISTSDLNSEDEQLRFTITRAPTKGHLESTDNPGSPVTSFTQVDLAGNKIYYVHTDDDEIKMDSFEFEVTDGYNSVFRTFRISISDVDNKKPIVFFNKLRIPEGGKGLITPFELKIEDKDTDDNKLKITITQVPVHGKILYNNLHPIKIFTMEDLRENRISYHHDGSESTEDNFSLTITDGTHMDFYVYPDYTKETRRPQTVEIEIVPVDNRIPQIVVNRGASFIGPLDHGQLGFRFTNKVLRAEDLDSQDVIIDYIITKEPEHGAIINKALGNESITNFTQGDINRMNIYYILDSMVNATSDFFHFKVVDEGSNELLDQDFRLHWAWISLEYDTYKINETEKYLKIKLFRRGYLGETSFVGIKTKNITAKQGEDFAKHYAKQVQFSPGQTEAHWRLRIINDNLFESDEEFEIVLEEPVMAAIEYPDKAVIIIVDSEDVSTVEFPEQEYVVREDVGEVLVPVQRKGDLSKEMMVICSAEAGSATGTIPTSIRSFSDFISRPESHKSLIRFNQGEEQKFCRLVIIDDSLYEDDESFKIRLSQPMGGRVGTQNETKIIISSDKNDVPFFYFGESEYYVDESDGHVEVMVWRTGTDLSKPASVTVRSKPSDPPSAEAGNDYVGIGKTLNFQPGVTRATFRVTILDDLGQPVLEGPETFELVMRMPMNAELGNPSQAVVTINDSLSDLPMMQFRESEYMAFENDGKISAYIVRSGDQGHESTVRCYTRQDTAKVTEDYVERPNTDDSLVVFEPGEMEKPCTVILVNDTIHEPDEIFRLWLGTPASDTAGGALVGSRNVTKLTIKDDGDKPVIKFEKNRFNVKEPRNPDDVTIVEIPVVRRGDLSETSHVRVHTKDGSAKSGKDYIPFSKELEFGQNVSRIIVEIQILYDEEKEHREALTLHLRPDRDMIADIEDTKVIIYIQELNIVADVTFPSQPIVVSLKDYDAAANAQSHIIPGYPVVCIT